MALSRTIGCGGGPSRHRHPHSARDAGSSNEGLPRCRAGGPSTSDTERPDRTPRQGVGCRPPRAEGLRRQYVGEYDEAKRSFRNSPNFDVTSPPEVNASATAVQPVYERDAKPYQDDKKNWQLGAIRGVLGKGKLATVVETARIEGENAHDFNSWIKIKPE